MSNYPLAVIVGPTGLVASIESKAGQPCVALKEPSNGHCPLFIFGSNATHVKQICEILNTPPVDLAETIEALDVLAKFANSAPGRLPSKIQEAIDLNKRLNPSRVTI